MSPDAIHWIASPFGSVDCFLMFSVRILSCFCTLGPLIFFGYLSNLIHSSTFFCSDENKRSSSVVLYEDASKKLLQQFTSALCGCQQMFHACSSISTLICSEGSQLIDLLSPGRILFFNAFSH